METKIEYIAATQDKLGGKIVTVEITDTSSLNLEKIMNETGADVLVF